jgi:cytochrome P450
VSAPTVASAFDPGDTGFIRNPHPVFHQMRRDAPVCRLPGSNEWAVTSYEHVCALLSDPRAAFTLEASTQPARPSRDAGHGQHPFFRAREESLRLLGRAFVNGTSENHTHFRRLLRAPFAQTGVASRRARIQGIADEWIGRALARGRIDVVADLARPVALTAAAELVGIPESQHQHFAAAALEFANGLGGASPLARERGLLARIELVSRVREIIPAPGRGPEGEATLLDLLARARERGEITDEDVVANGVVLFFASYMNAHHSVGNAALSLVRNPDQWELLRSRPDTTATAVEELIRYETSGPVIQRRACDDIEIAGAMIPRGNVLLLMVGAANRDPAVFPDPDRLDVTRSPSPHLGFGHGVHSCLGAALARLDVDVAVRTLVNRVRAPQLEHDDLEWEPSFTVRGLKALPLVFEATG